MIYFRLWLFGIWYWLFFEVMSKVRRYRGDTAYFFSELVFPRCFFVFRRFFFVFRRFFLFVQHFCFLDFSYLGKTKINVVISNLCCSLKLKLFASLWVQDNGLLSRDNKTLSCENDKKNVVQYKKKWINDIRKKSQ